MSQPIRHITTILAMLICQIFLCLDATLLANCVVLKSFRPCWCLKNPNLSQLHIGLVAAKEAANEHFESGLNSVFHQLNRINDPAYPFTVCTHASAHAERNDEGIASTGWETMLGGLNAAGFMINGTWLSDAYWS
ncbi:MAG: hypothetical protein R2856_27955 [Caldilineaceae bacterium]